MAHRHEKNEYLARETRGVILAGAHAWDGQVLDDLLPRCLLPVALTPLVIYGLRWFKQAGLTAVMICANGASRCARRYLGDGAPLGLRLDYYEDWVPRGPAGCIHDACVDTPAQTFIVTEGAVIPPFVAGELLDHHHRSGAALTVVLRRRSGGADDGPAALEPAGVYCLDRRVLDHIPPASYQDLKEILLPKLRRAGELEVPFVIDQPVARVVSLDSYLAVNEYMTAAICHAPGAPPGYRRLGESLVHTSAHICPTARLVGPNLIGPRVFVADAAVIVGPTAIGADCTIEADATVSRSVLWDRCRVGRGAAAHRAIMPTAAALAAGGVARCRLARPGSETAELSQGPASPGAEPAGDCWNPTTQDHHAQQQALEHS